MCLQAPSISASSASAHTSGSLTLGGAHQLAPNPCCSHAAMRMPLCSFTALHLALNLFPNRRQGAAVALYDPRTNGERLLATGAVEMDNPCDCLLFSASLVQAASCCTRPSVCVVRRAAIGLPPWLLTASGVLWAWQLCRPSLPADAPSGLLAMSCIKGSSGVQLGVCFPVTRLLLTLCHSQHGFTGLYQGAGQAASLCTHLAHSACRPPGKSFLKLFIV